MQRKTRKKSSHALGQKLRKAIENIQVDVFGHQKTVSKNIHSYVEGLASDIGIPKDQLIIRIFKDYRQVQVGIYRQGKRIREIPVSELVLLFTGKDPLEFPHLEQKAIRGIEGFMKEYSDTHAIPLNDLQICVQTFGVDVMIKGIHRTSEIGAIPLLSLIKHFLK